MIIKPKISSSKTGHEVIAKALTPPIERLIPPRPQGGILVKWPQEDPRREADNPFSFHESQHKS
jgi:hypothetical protein